MHAYNACRYTCRILRNGASEDLHSTQVEATPGCRAVNMCSWNSIRGLVTVIELAHITYT